MRKIAVLTTALALLLATSAQAKDLGGKFGLGYQATLGGAQGLSLSYFVSQAFAIDLLLGMKFAIPDVTDTQVGFNAAIGIRYNFARAKETNLGIGLLVDLGYLNDQVIGPDGSFHANIEIPLVLEHFFGEHFAITLGTGITIEIIPEDGAVFAEGGANAFRPAAGAKGFSLSFFNGSLFGQAGFKFYF